MAQSHFAKVSSPLGDDALILRHMTGREELGRLFEYELELLSKNDEIKLADVLAQPMTVHIELPGEKIRHFNGTVTRFARTGDLGRHTIYRATLRPWLWLLTRSADCRIFQHLTIPDVIKQVFRDHGQTDFDEALSQSYRTWDYLVQYRETAYNFVTRLMEQAGIYFFFKHEDGKHTLMLADSYSAHEPAPGYEEVPYYPPEGGEKRERDHIDSWRVSGQIQSGAYMLNDFDFTRPKASLQAKLTSPNAKSDYEVYDYPGEYNEASDGEADVRVRLEELQAQQELVEGAGNARGITPGALLKLTGFPRKDQNREYLIVSTSYDVEPHDHESGTASGQKQGSGYRCAFTAIESRTPYRLASITPKATIVGPQTAVVVGKAGEEIWTDEYGRVKLQFHWDRLGKSNEESSCWVRVAQLWAGGAWGGMHIPRIGQEVVVEFLEGDPDRPLVTGRVYNGNNKPPYALPGNQTQSGIKSRSTKGGNPDNFNELRFEDKKGEEQVYLQAEKNQDILVKNDESHTVGHDRTKTIKNNETVSVGVDRTETVGANETIAIGANRTETVGANESISVSGTRTETVTLAETISIGAAQMLNVGAAQMINVVGGRMVDVGVAQVTNIGAIHSVNVGGAETVNIGGSRTHSVAKDSALNVGQNSSLKVAKDHGVTVGGSESVSVTGERSQSIGKGDSLKVGKALIIEAADEVVIKTGDASITMKKNGDIVIKGKNISSTGSGKIQHKADGNVVIKGSKVSAN